MSEHATENAAIIWGHFCYNQTPTILPAYTPRCPQCGALNLSRALCACGDCYHPAFGPDTDGDPCDWCQDCGCPSADHTRPTPPGKSDPTERGESA